jgi:ATP-dependent DNA helicase DinG
LPASNTVIFDEAHQLPETATLFFGESVSSSQLQELARDARHAGLAHAADFDALQEAAAALDKAARDLRLALPEANARLPASEIAARDGFAAALATTQERLAQLRATLESQAERHQELANCLERADAFAARLAGWRGDSGLGDGQAIEGFIRWGEVFAHSLALHLSPLSIARLFRAQVFSQKRAWIFTSATLAVKGDFAHYQDEMGLADQASDPGEDPLPRKRIVTASWSSPFDFEAQALLYVPDALPLPNTAEHTRAVVEAALPLVEAAGGRAFLLFTSLKAMDAAHELLLEVWRDRAWKLPLMKQGEGTRSELLERFRQLGNAVLVASHSFWEGVDVKGSALSLVVIDKLPFAPPDDPVLAARLAEIERNGGNAFMQYQVPNAAIVLKQGAGRLIRDEDDRGVLMIADRRLIEKPYGRRLWQSLPPMRRTRDQDEATAFLRAAREPIDPRSAWSACPRP